MKFQKSPIPYVLVLLFLVIGLPIMDYRINDDLVLEYEIIPEKREQNPIQTEDYNEKLITHLQSFAVAN